MYNPQAKNIPAKQLNTNTESIKNFIFYNDFLYKHIGRNIKVEYSGNSQGNEFYGKLINVGKDFIVIKLPVTPLSTIIFKNEKINKITIIFDGE